MDTFTSACLAPTMPAKGSLESIGSVRAMHERANAETADNSDFGQFQKESDPYADHIFQMFGQEAYDDYIRDVAAKRQRERSEAAEKLSRRTARLLAMRRFLSVHTRIATLVTNVASKVPKRHITA